MQDATIFIPWSWGTELQVTTFECCMLLELLSGVLQPEYYCGSMDAPSVTVSSPGAIPTLSIFYLSPYHYIPTRGVCEVMLILFSFVTVLHFIGALGYRLWWVLPTICLAGAGEIAGWAARLWSSHDPFARNPFLIQIITTILSPTPLLGAIFIMFSRLSEILGVQYSRLSPRWYSRIFLSCDIIALTVQGLGGGIAASAQGAQQQKTLNLGSNIMLGGILFQLAAMMTFIFLVVEYFTRFFSNQPLRPKPEEPKSFKDDASVMTLVEARPWTPRTKLMSASIALCMFFLLVRSIYRTAELADGWDGKIISTEVLFNFFDGAMVVLTMYTLIFLHPSYLLPTSKASGSPLSKTVSA
ncbi:hypothetical protein NM688_g2490 [Phlebia brevispora]|uniref:Uncharacterized protein n=1 Tax=Phlebia brevispora TaxID=194682 RepID=A0ACC1T8K6_9APHY|nr:hypothetical protein NM688_g2490 [Phlebia brevispora]